MTRTKQITATVTAHYIDFTGDTYTVRRDIQAQGGVWDADKQHWRVTPVTVQTVAWAASIATTFNDTRTNPYTSHPNTPPTQDPTPMTQATDTSDAPTADAPVIRRRINRTADIPDAVSINPIPQTDAATAFKTFLEAVGGLPTAPQPTAPAMDFDAVKQLIEAALTPVIAELNKRPTTQVTVTTPRQPVPLTGCLTTCFPISSSASAPA